MFAALAVILAVTIPPAPRDFIADQAGILTNDREMASARIAQASAQLKGVNLGVLTLTDLDDDPKAVAVRTLNYWNMTPDSVLVLISMNPRKVYLQPGSNYASVFNESVATEITRGMVPYMKRRDFSGAVAYAFIWTEDRLKERAAPQTIPGLIPQPVATPVAQDQGSTAGEFFTWLLVFFGVIAAVGGVIFLVKRFKRKQEEELHEYKMQWRATKGFTENYAKPGEIKQYTGPVEPGVRASGGHGPGIVAIGGSSNDLLTGVLIGNALSNNHRETVREVVHYDYARPAPPPAPAYEPPSHSRSFDSDSSSSGFGGGGSDWGSSGGGFDSSSGGGGGGSDW